MVLAGDREPRAAVRAGERDRTGLSSRDWSTSPPITQAEAPRVRPSADGSRSQGMVAAQPAHRIGPSPGGLGRVRLHDGQVAASTAATVQRQVLSPTVIEPASTGEGKPFSKPTRSGARTASGTATSSPQSAQATSGAGPFTGRWAPQDGHSVRNPNRPKRGSASGEGMAVVYHERRPPSGTGRCLG